MVAAGNERPLLEVKETVFSGPISITQKRTVVVSQDGTISMKGGKPGKASLTGAELQALRDFLNSKAIQGLGDAYRNADPQMDRSGAMQIEITSNEMTKRISLSAVDFGGDYDLNGFPAPVHELVCKVYGLGHRVGIPYGRTVQDGSGGRRADRARCDAASLELIPKSFP
jgi:hypothetical protein